MYVECLKNVEPSLSISSGAMILSWMNLNMYLLSIRNLTLLPLGLSVKKLRSIPNVVFEIVERMYSDSTRVGVEGLAGGSARLGLFTGL